MPAFLTRGAGSLQKIVQEIHILMDAAAFSSKNTPSPVQNEAGIHITAHMKTTFAISGNDIMKHLLLQSLAIAALLIPFAAHADSYKFDPNHTAVVWHANHFGFSNPSGRFTVKEGTLNLDEAKPENSSVDAVVDIDSLVTGIDKLNEHLKSPDFFDAAKFPTAEFKSTSVKVTGKDTADVTGDLTLHGVTRPVTLHMTLNKIGVHPMSQKKAVGFTGAVTVKRSEFGIDKYVPAVSDDIVLEIEAEAQVQ
jgi:polyisoprenoid-binding protein YceI